MHININKFVLWLFYFSLIFYEIKLWFSGNGLTWSPKSSTLICSEDFIGAKKSDSELSPNYAPTIFSLEHCNSASAAATNRFSRTKHLKYFILNILGKTIKCIYFYA